MATRAISDLSIDRGLVRNRRVECGFFRRCRQGRPGPSVRCYGPEVNRRRWLLISTVPFFLLFGCGTEPPPTDALDGSPFDAAAPDSGLAGVEVSFGTGQIDWEDVPVAGGQLELIYGAQGGYHVWGRGRFHGFAPDIDVAFTAVDLATGTLLHMQTWARRRIENNVSYGLESVGGGTFETDAELVVLNIQCASEVVGHQLQVRVFVRERATMRVGTDVRTATVVDVVNPTACVTH